ncbi:hypothetical protein BHE74_00054826, partial [Ensete ventricosum]
GGGVLRWGVLLGSVLIGVLPVATSAEEHPDASASTLGLFGLLVGRSCDIAPPSSVKNVTKLLGVELRCWLDLFSSKCFILVGGELINTLSLTLVVPRDMAELYGGRAAAAAWGEGVTLHATLMGVELRSVIPDHLPFGYLIDYRLSPSG